MGGRANDDSTGRSLEQATWDTIVDSIIVGECTPFLGAGISVPYLPSGGELATILAKAFDYPLDDKKNLARVTQYIASMRDESAFVRRRVGKAIKDAQDEAAAVLLNGPPQNHIRLAQLGLPIYVTTNYDNYLERAFPTIGGAKPRVEICQWNDSLAEDRAPYSKDPPTPDQPMIFHLHGHIDDPNSILVTEDDYIDFTVSLARSTDKNRVIPHIIRRALGNSNLLFIGYSLADWNFRVLMRYLMKQQRVQQHEKRSSISIQLSDDEMDPDRRASAERFLEAYLGTSNIKVYWGAAEPFLIELQRQLDLQKVGGEAS